MVFAPKYRRKRNIWTVKTRYRRNIKKNSANKKRVEIIEAEACPDHIHMLLNIPPHISIAQFMGFLKGKSSLMIFDRHANLKYKYGSRNFWCRGYYVDTVGRNKKVIAEYIRNQIEEDYASDQISLKEYTDPFTGSKNK
ncbi:MAG: IS200/IS605 family transposase [Clostridiales bacterium]|nr:MAG: IS200/IS605 family transposase [Clostridiales bacterium]